MDDVGKVSRLFVHNASLGKGTRKGVLSPFLEDKKMKCDRCGAEITPATVNDNPHNLILLGWTSETGTTTNERYNVCSKCADDFDRWMKDAELG